LTTICLSLNLYWCEETCPEAATIAPCNCVLDTFPSGQIYPEIQCIGPAVTDLRQTLASVFLSSGNGQVRVFSALYINNTAITEVPSGTFGDATFHSIFFGNNMQLRHIDPHAFRKLDAQHSVLNQVDFYNNPLLGATNQSDLFELVNNLHPKHSLDMARLGITEIPNNAFTLNSELMHIFIQHNPKLQRIGSYAFSFLPNLLNLIMHTNVLTAIDSHAFDLSSVHDDVEVDLSFNQLTQSSFTNMTFGVQGRAPAEVILWANKLTSLPSNVFRSHLGVANGIQKLYLHDNPIVCDCHVRWIRDDNLAAVVPNVPCTDRQGRNLFTLEINELPATEC
jgi:hypothetical protein